MIDISSIRALNRPERIAITEHARLRLIERGLTIGDVMQCIASGEIIEQYEDDTPFPSCLVLGLTMSRRPVHVVVSHDDGFIYLITAYLPDTQKWSSDYKTRKEQGK